MKSLAVLATALAVCAYADEEATEEVAVEEAVYTLTADNFDEFMSSHDKVLVEFYAPWCGHCKALAPEFENAAQFLHGEEAIDAVLAKVDATENKELGGKYGVRGFPTLKWFSGDVENPSDYGGGRTEPTIIDWVSKRCLPAVSELADEAAVDAFKEKNRLALIAYFEGDKDSSEDVAAIFSVADSLRESVSVGLVQSSENKIVLFRQFDEPEVTYAGELSVDGLSEFVNAERFPLVDAIGPENFRDYQTRGLPLVWIAVDGTDEEQMESIVTLITPYATQFKGKLSFVHVDNNKYQQHVTGLGITSVPGLLLMGDGNMKYLYQSDLTNAEDLETFFDSYADGSLESFLKSEPVPEPNDEPVTVIVGKSFSDYVGTDKDVFLEFYAPWCGHCKKLAPDYEKVGAAYSGVEGVVIAKVDATENDTPEEVKGFPTLMFYPAGSTTGVKYGGGRTAEDIIAWIEEHATVDVAGVVKEEL